MSFRVPGERQNGGKFLVFGEESSGKTCFALTFPNVAIIDSDDGVAEYEKKEIEIGGKKYNNIIFVENSSELNTLKEDIDDVVNGAHPEIKTLVIDSETQFYNAIQISALKIEERRARRNKSNVDDTIISKRQWGKIKLIILELQQMKFDLTSQGIHLVSVAQDKPIYDKSDEKKVIGHMPDVHKLQPYNYDVILYFYTNENKTTGETKFFAKVMKDRTNVTQKGQVIENCTYDLWREYYESKANLPIIETSYRKDLTHTEQNMMDGDCLMESNTNDTCSEWKELIKEMKRRGEDDLISQVNIKIKEMGIKPNQLNQTAPEDMETLLRYTKKLLS